MSTTDTTPDDRIEKAIEQLKAWAAEKEIPFSAVLEALEDGTEKEQDGSLPPFHRSVVWADVYDDNGIKFHVVVREGATHSSLMDNLLVASAAMNTLIDTRGWMPADRKPKTDEELAEIRASTQATLDKLSASNKGAQTGETPSRAHGEHSQDVVQYEGSDARLITVEEIFKGVTQSGKTKYVVKGWPWKQYGVTCWPDSGKISKLSALLDLDTWEIGTGKVVDEGLQAVVRLKEEGKPDKVVDWLGDGVLSEELPEGPEF